MELLVPFIIYTTIMTNFNFEKYFTKLVISKFPAVSNLVVDETEGLIEFILGLNYLKYEITEAGAFTGYYSMVGESIKFDEHPLFWCSYSFSGAVADLIGLNVTTGFCVDTY